MEDKIDNNHDNNSDEKDNVKGENHFGKGKIDYGADDIKVLEGLDGVRKRPAMYIGDTGTKGLHHLVYEVVDNSIDEAMAGHCNEIEVSLRKDGSVEIKDNGRGIPVDVHKKTGLSALEVVTTKLHAGGKFENKAYQVSGGLHGVGLSVVNALSEWMIIKVHKNGKIYSQKYERGYITTPVKIIGNTLDSGTIVYFKPDSTIFQTTDFDFDYLSKRFKELAFLNKGLKITLSDEEQNREEIYHYEGGIVKFVEELNKGKVPLISPLYYEKKVGDVLVEYSLQYTSAFTDLIYSFVNNIHTVEGGTHLSGFKTALTRAINDYFKSQKSTNKYKNKNKNYKGEKKLSGSDILEGLTCVLSIKIPNPQFEGQTKTKLGNGEIKGIVDSIVFDSLKNYLEENPSDARNIMKKVMSSMEAREAAHKARDVIRRKSVFESSILPGKLADCLEKDARKSELYLVEGDSAGGSCKQGRNRHFQAVLPLKGKILNVEKASLNRVLTDNEIKTIILSLGSGFGNDFDISKLRYHKIFIMTDADVDGSHIRTLLLTLFYRYFRKLVEGGHIYIAQPPLYKLKKGKTVKYAYSDDEKNKVIAQMGNQVSVQRYKGLGEMNPEQLWDTTLNPEKRLLKRVVIEDAEEADRIFSILMGPDVEPRRAFIEAHAKEVENLDI